MRPWAPPACGPVMLPALHPSYLGYRPTLTSRYDFLRYEIKYGIRYYLTEPRRALQPPKGTQWFPRIGLFVVQAISLGPCRRPIEFLTSSNPWGHFSKITNFQIHKIEKWKFLSPFRPKDFFVISHEHKDSFFEVIWPKKNSNTHVQIGPESFRQK